MLSSPTVFEPHRPNGESQLGTLVTSEALERQRKLVGKLQKLLLKHPGNLTKVAKEVNMERSELVIFMAQHSKAFQAAEDEYLDDITEKVMKSAKGESFEGFHFGNAIKLLKEKRPEEWGGKVRDKPEAPEIPEGPSQPSYATRVVEDYRGKFREQRATAQPNIIRTEDT